MINYIICVLNYIINYNLVEKYRMLLMYVKHF